MLFVTDVVTPNKRDDDDTAQAPNFQEVPCATFHATKNGDNLFTLESILAQFVSAIITSEREARSEFSLG